MAQSILLDGLNLALKTGTGIATYSRGVMAVARELGYGTTLLHASAGRLSADPTLQEILLFDDASDTVMSKKRRLQRWLKRRVGAPGGLKLNAFAMNGVVVARSFNKHLAEVDRIFAHEDLFGLARGHFKTYGRSLTLKLSQRPDVFHSTYPLPIAVKSAPSIQTIHDLVPLRLPYLSDDNKRYYYRMLRALTKQADHIVTVSETSRRDIVKLFGMDEARITNTYQAVELPREVLQRDAGAVADEVSGVFDLGWRQYFLFFGALEPKKNVLRLIEAYLAARCDTPLVIVGAVGWRADVERKMLEDGRFGYYELSDKRVTYQQKIRRFEYVSLPLLISLIRGARGVVFPSLYEGFGLPVLEAMMLGTPVISSTEGSIPEVAADAAILVDPYDVGALTKAIRALARDDDLHAHFSEAGPKRASEFSFKTYAERMGSVYRNVIG
ncbi:glycosyltransferase family 4 protein [Bradyrhizobium sp.]|uniref:glycosyltransferase family 4 protein n=1 Tax=Bradyrhizobium sp. TaxID=376 RepID=UPI0039E3FD70